MHSQYKYNISEIYKTTISKNYQKFSDTCGKWDVLIRTIRMEIKISTNEKNRLVAKHPLHKNHALHLPVPHPQFNKTSGDNSTTHMILP
jgi:hypothetical protein